MGLARYGIAYLLFALLYFVLFALGVTVCGLYGTELRRASVDDKHADSKWIYAVIVGALSALTAVLYFVPFFMRFMAVFIWNSILFVLWIALFGVFGQMYIHEDPEDNPDVIRLKRAVWVDLAGAIGWLMASIAAFVYWFTHRERLSRFTGRAKV